MVKGIMRQTIRKYYLTSFYLLTLVLSALLLPLHFLFKSVGNYAVSFTQWSPALALVLLSFILKDKTIFSDLKHRFRVDKTVAKWLLPAIVIPALGIIISGLILTILQIDYVPWTGDLPFYLLSFFAILIGCAAEEVGWRGFLLPQLQRRHSPFISSMIVGVLWGIWHLNFTGGIWGFVLYTVTIIEMSILMTWLFNKSNGNVLLMTVWHLVFNLASRIFLWERFVLELFVVESIVFAIPCIFILLRERKTARSNSTVQDICEK